MHRSLPGVHLLAAACLWLALGTAGPPARAADYTVGIEDLNLYPIARVRAGTYEGFVRDLLDAFARSAGHRFHYKVLPVQRLTAAHLAGEVDLVFPDEPKWHAEQKGQAPLLYSFDVVAFQDAVMVRPPLGQPLRSLGLVHGFTPWKFQERIRAGSLRTESAIEPGNLLKMVMRGRIDGAYMPLEVASYQLQEMGTPGALVPDTVLMPLKTSHYRASSLHQHELIRTLNRFITEETGLITQLRERYRL
ncbi:hypothetical protein ACS5PK_16015 [Roseateles sp. DB2]|uniref:hypothetical protein n=1 Tax=Roseateles sp. DB2 TaxID=3453717 RepID=UPI003EEAA9CE